MTRVGDDYWLVTCRHVVDPTYRPMNQGRRNANLLRVVLTGFGLKKQDEQRYHTRYVANFDVGELNFGSDDNDLAAILVPKDRFPIVEGKTSTLPRDVDVDLLADLEYLQKLYPGEQVAFSGYPSNSPVSEEQVGTGQLIHFRDPLYRQGVLARHAVLEHSVDGALGSGYCLVDAFAQSGFSGAPLIALQKALPPGAIKFADFRPMAVIGLICGHYRSGGDRSDGIHAGLSYFVSSRHIRTCLDV